METSAVTLIVLALLTLLYSLWMMGQPRLAERRRRRVRAQPFPDAWRRVLQRRVPYFRRLPPDLQWRLKKRMQVFLAEKAFIGCRGLRVTEEMRVTIAAQACLLILSRPGEGYPNLRQILVYPGPFVVDRVETDGSGVLQDRRRVLAGESWQRGQVILSWQDALAGAASVDDGQNVVIHEFAHQLDQENGPANGAPAMPGRARARRWSEVMGAEFARLQRQAERHEPSLFSHYGATEPAEFFAVASEVFFEQPHRLQLDCPAVYGELSAFYGVDPTSWS